MNYKELVENYEPINEQEETDKRLMLKYIDLFPEILTRDNEICHFTASSWVVNKERTKAIMIYHNIYKSWAWTGGHADGDPDLFHVAQKEVEEETGIKNLTPLGDGLASLEIISVDSHIKRGKFVSTHLHLNCSFIFEADENEAIRIKEDENSGVKWVDMDEAVKLSTEEKMKYIYQKLIDKVKIAK